MPCLPTKIFQGLLTLRYPEEVFIGMKIFPMKEKKNGSVPWRSKQRKMIEFDLRSAVGVVVDRQKHIAIFISYNLCRRIDQSILRYGSVFFNLGG